MLRSTTNTLRYACTVYCKAAAGASEDGLPVIVVGLDDEQRRRSSGGSSSRRRRLPWRQRHRVGAGEAADGVADELHTAPGQGGRAGDSVAARPPLRVRPLLAAERLRVRLLHGRCEFGRCWRLWRSSGMIGAPSLPPPPPWCTPFAIGRLRRTWGPRRKHAPWLGQCLDLMPAAATVAYEFPLDLAIRSTSCLRRISPMQLCQNLGPSMD